MSDEDAFLRKLLENPADDTARLVYADWLDERGEAAKAEFLRLTAEVVAVTPRRAKARAKVVENRLRELAADLDTGWLAVVSKMEIERCGQVRQLNFSRMQRFGHRLFGQQEAHPTPQFEFECPKQWENLDATADPNVRFCKGCRENVHYCDTIVVARDHAARGRCVAVDLGIIRKEGDLEEMRRKMGRMLPDRAMREWARIQAERKPDPVSEKREQAKRQPDDTV